MTGQERALVPRFCGYEKCGKQLVRGADERLDQFLKRETCGKKCGTNYGVQKRRKAGRPTGMAVVKAAREKVRPVVVKEPEKPLSGPPPGFASRMLRGALV